MLISLWLIGLVINSVFYYLLYRRIEFIRSCQLRVAKRLMRLENKIDFVGTDDMKREYGTDSTK